MVVPLGRFHGLPVCGCRLLDTTVGIGKSLSDRVVVCEVRGMGVGGHAWRHADVLCQHLRSRGLVKGRRVVELGAGTGICGLACARLGAETVLLTDHWELCPTLRLNAELNSHVTEQSEPAPVTVAKLSWGAELPEEVMQTLATSSTPLLIPVSFCIYNPISDELLAQTLGELLLPCGQDTLAVLTHSVNSPADNPANHAFFKALDQQGLAWCPVEVIDLDADTRGDAITVLIVHVRPVQQGDLLPKPMSFVVQDEQGQGLSHNEVVVWQPG